MQDADHQVVMHRFAAFQVAGASGDGPFDLLFGSWCDLVLAVFELLEEGVVEWM